MVSPCVGLQAVSACTLDPESDPEDPERHAQAINECDSQPHGGVARHCPKCAIRTTGDNTKQDNVIELFEDRLEPAVSRYGIEAPQEERPDRGVGDQNAFAGSRVQRGSLSGRYAGHSGSFRAAVSGGQSIAQWYRSHPRDCRQESRATECPQTDIRLR